MTLLRPCPGCEELLSVGRRHDHRNRGRRPTDTARWKRRSRLDRARHLAAVGPICPGWRRPAHRVDASQLTDDHVVPLVHGGDPYGETQVLCVGCNSAKRDRPAEVTA